MVDKRMWRGVARGEKAEGKGHQQREERAGQSHLHGFQGRAHDGLRKSIVPPAPPYLRMLFVQRQR